MKSGDVGVESRWSLPRRVRGYLGGDLLPLALLCLFSVLLRLALLDRPIGYDEAYTYLHYVSAPFWEAIRTYDRPNNHLFHTVCAWPLVRLFGPSAVSLRLPVFLSGVASIPICYVLGRRISNSFTGLMAAALAAGSFHLVIYSVDARGYGLQTTLLLLALCLLPRLIEDGTFKRVAAISILLSLGLFTVPTLVFGAGTVFIWGFWLAFRKDPARRKTAFWNLIWAALLTTGLTLLLYLPAIHFVLTKRLAFPAAEDYVDLPAHFAHLGRYLASGLPSGLPWFILGAVLVGLGIDLFRRRRMSVVLLWLFWPLASLLLHYAYSTRAPFERNFLFLIPLLLILSSHGLSSALSSWHRLGDRPRRWMTLCVAFALFAWPAHHTFSRYRDVQEAAFRSPLAILEKVKEHLHSGDYLALSGSILERLSFYAEIEGRVRFEALGGRSFRFAVAQLLHGDQPHYRPFSKRRQGFFLLEVRGDEKVQTVKWLGRQFPSARFTFDPVWSSIEKRGKRISLFRVHRRPGG